MPPGLIVGDLRVAGPERHQPVRDARSYYANNLVAGGAPSRSPTVRSSRTPAGATQAQARAAHGQEHAGPLGEGARRSRAAAPGVDGNPELEGQELHLATAVTTRDARRLVVPRRRRAPRRRLGPRIHSVRVSVTDRCNFRCRYCMPAEGLAMVAKHEVLTFEEIAPLSCGPGAHGCPRGAAHRGRAARATRLARARATPRRRARGVEDLSLTTNGVLLDRLAAPAGRRRAPPAQRLARLALARALRADHPPRRARSRPRGLDAAAARRASCDRSRSTASPSAASPRARSRRCAELARRKPLRRALHRVHAARRRPIAGDADQVLSGAEIRAIIEERYGPLHGDPGAGGLDRAALPLRRRRGRAGLRQPRVRAVLLELRPHPRSPPTGSCAPVCSRVANGICRRRCATAPAMPSSRR